jgi:glutamine---fructose-6-phosphate transaminase (isomerizing)
MCGIFGVVVSKDSIYSYDSIKNLLSRIALLSESRGKESSGIAVVNHKSKKINVLRSSMRITNLLKNKKFNKIINSIKINKTDKKLDNNFIVIGHTRLVTNGSQLNNNNNQPVVKNGIIATHNGIIVNANEIWNKYKNLKREYEIDTEILLSLIRYNLSKKKNCVQSVIKSIKNIYGTVATAILFNDIQKLLLTTNNGSLYILTNFKDILVFASEKYMLEQLFTYKKIKPLLKNCKLIHIKPNEGFVVSLKKFKIKNFKEYNNKNYQKQKNIYNINIDNIIPKLKEKSSLVNINKISKSNNKSKEEKLLEYDINKINNLVRCKKCLLPETFPFIEFNKKGICNYCNNYKKLPKTKPFNILKKIAEKHNNNNKPNVIIPFSGGRDSSFVLHMIKKELGLNPITYTYDWGMVTDLARRNIARMCGKLGVENIIISANIAQKREYIKKNILAWLKKPSLGMIPLFMAGDKYFFYYCNKLKKQTGINLNIWGVNDLETTYFKAGFGGLKPWFDRKKKYGMPLMSHFSLIKYVTSNVIKNPSYINSSIIETLGSYLVKNISPRKDYYRFFDYYKWNEKEIENLLIKEYNWETAKDTNSTWRIGDGTASFYNYIYNTVAGFTESDTFRSNQIREGIITRKEGLKMITEENKPRYESIKWYLEIVGLDFKKVIQKINKIPKRY